VFDHMGVVEFLQHAHLHLRRRALLHRRRAVTRVRSGHDLMLPTPSCDLAYRRDRSALDLLPPLGMHTVHRSLLAHPSRHTASHSARSRVVYLSRHVRSSGHFLQH
jgi:hypothetical protein